MENDLTVSALADCVKRSDNVEVAYATSVVKYDRPSSKGGLLDVHLSGDRTISARLAVSVKVKELLVKHTYIFMLYNV